MLIHCVYFWLKPDLTSEQRQTFERGVAMLGDIDHASAVWLGGAASTAPRPVVDASYDCALICMFPDVAAHDAYQADPIHEQFIVQCRDLWQRVQIYDSEAKGIG